MPIAALTASGFTLMALAGVWFFTQSPAKTPQNNIAYSEKLENFPPGTDIVMDFITDDTTYSYNTDLPEGQALENNEQTKAISATSNKYIIHSAAQISDTDYLDIEFSIDKLSDNVSVSLSGLPLKAQAYLTINGRNDKSSMPVDWAGRLTFDTKANRKLSGSHLCLVMHGLTENKATSLCHYVPANEGQVSS